MYSPVISYMKQISTNAHTIVAETHALRSMWSTITDGKCADQRAEEKIISHLVAVPAYINCPIKIVKRPNRNLIYPRSLQIIACKSVMQCSPR